MYDAEFKKMTPVTKHATSIISITGVLAERYGRVHMVLIKKRYLYMFTASYYSMVCT